MRKDIVIETSVSRRRIWPLCREVLAAQCHGGKEYTGAWTMREEMYTKIVAMAVARYEGSVVGWAWVASRGNASSVGFLGTWVNGEWRRQGLGREMAEAVIALYPKDVTAEAVYAEGVAFYKAVFPDPPSQTRRHSGHCFHFLK